MTIERVAFAVMLIGALTAVATTGAAPVGYVETGSMRPALDSGDGFVALPPIVTGSPSSGDVVVYRAERVNGGGLTTHRVIERTDRGLITKGDANAFTDQAAGEPPVSRERVVAVALSVGGEVVAIPGVGRLGGAVQGVLSWVAGVLGLPRRAVLIAVAALTALLILPETRQRSRSRARESATDPRLIVVGLGIVVMIALSASLLVPLGPTTYEVVAAERDVPGPAVIPTGSAETITYAVPGGRIVPTLVVLSPASDGVAVETNRLVVKPGETAEADVTLSAPAKTGRYDRQVRERRYPLVLPRPLIDGLRTAHPLAPLVILDAVVLMATGLAAFAVGAGRPHNRGSGGRGSRIAGLFRRSER